ncbi:hypothetical protein EG68_08373 [Paragonimus skrjabini miyazakii]|uniref:Aminoacyl-transfer RNA synthetases class-II family profile domain-containing protein n=1 Tax=Paragonimus skrjabini miyazakii TaxID=59628 RepID=A0A8S9YNU3_9TREM|nr:hypothetical protein EG68_08373 [Paragonimus skrjabini miyazakii]
MSTGDVEVIAHNLHVLSEVETELAFPVTSQNPANEFLRLQYRYLDLRSEVLQRNLRFRSTFILTIRQFLCLSYGFLEVETPYLFRKTPGGANEFLTPTTYPGLFYSLPQSPQQFKQLLMVGGFDRYMQIARCFRDEPSRSDRQPEFTQLDLELAFANATDIMQVVEDLLLHVWPLVRNIRKDDCLLQTPFPKITYSAAISQFGSDKPDIRFAFRFCKPSANGCVGFKIPLSTASMISEPDWKRLTENTYLNTGVNIYFNTPCSSSSDFDCLSKSLEAEPSDTIVFVRDHTEKELKALGLARTMLAEVLHAKGVPIYEPGIHFLWVDNFPLFERIDDDSWSSVHHPFTAPTPDTLSFIYSNPEKVVSQHYDLVCNGQEVGGGSIRIHDASIQEYVLSDILKEDTKTMSYFMTALRSGAPPHGGIALGLDRLLAILLNANSIREVIAFPKASDGKDLMSGAPAHISEDDLKRYNLAVTAK